MRNKKAEIYQDYMGNNFFVVGNDNILCAKIDDDFCDTALYFLYGDQPIRGNEKENQYFHGNSEITKEEYEKIKFQYIEEIDSIYKENNIPNEINNISGIGWLVLELREFVGPWEL